jgi:hypothetical protein
MPSGAWPSAAAAWTALSLRSWSADADEWRVGLYVEGPDASEVRDSIVGAAPKGTTVTSADAVVHVRPIAGRSRLFAGKRKGAAHEVEVRRIREAAAAAGLEAVVAAEVRREGRRVAPRRHRRCGQRAVSASASTPGATAGRSSA